MGAADIDAIFANIEKAEIFGSGTYMSEGRYRVETKNIFVQVGHKGKSFIAEFTVLQSSRPEDHEVGSSGSWVVKFDWSSALGNITKFVAALLGYDPNDKKVQNDPAIRKEVGQVVRAVCGSELAQKELGEDYEVGMLNGIQLDLECITTTTKVKKEDFTVYNWSPVGG